MSYRPLGIVKEIIEQTGLEVTHVYDDLVFVEHSPFLIQFDDDNPDTVRLHFNVDIKTEARDMLERRISDAASERKLQVKTTGRFEMTQREDSEEIDIHFLED